MRICPRSILLLLLTLLFISPGVVWANSGPTYWQGYPSSEVLAVDPDCPVEVAEENLFFDFSDESIRDYTIWGKVKAAYRMVNPTDQDLSVQMAFPFVSSLRNFSPVDVVITADGVQVPYKVYLGNGVKSRKNSFQENGGDYLVFENILSTVSNQPYQACHFSLDEKGLLYTLEVRPTTEERVNFVVEFEFDEAKTKVLTRGFNSYERSGKKVKIASRCYEREILEIFVLGNDIKFNINAYADGDQNEPTELFTYQISSRETELKSYLKSYIDQYQEELRQQWGLSGSLPLDEVQFYNLYSKALDQAFTAYEGYAFWEDLGEQDYLKRIFVLVYKVDFPARGQRNVTVEYKTAGTMDKTKTIKPVYSFQYLLNPAAKWSRFGDLAVEIVTPKEAPYIVESSLALNKEGERFYRAGFNSLPDKDLYFTVYEKEKISLVDKILDFFRISYLFLEVLIILSILIVSLLIIFKRRTSIKY